MLKRVQHDKQFNLAGFDLPAVGQDRQVNSTAEFNRRKKMTYNFDEIIDRHGTSCIKFDFALERHHKEDELSFWVADMDFRTAKPILDALHERIDHGIFGYTDPDEAYFESVRRWYSDNFRAEFEREQLTVTPGVVFAIAAAVHAFTERGEAVLIQSPVYYPFKGTIQAAGRRAVSSDLVWKDGRYEIDFDDFERKIAEEKPGLFLLCSPHNPGGRCWTREELERMAEICMENRVVVFSDEIHSDFVWKPNAHTVFSTLPEKAARNCLVATAPTKTFNLAALQVSNIFVPNPELNLKFRRAVDALGYSQPNALGLTACRAAYDHGSEWLGQAKAYIERNLDFAVDFISKRIPEIDAPKPEATYLLWLDCRALPLDDRALNHKIRDEAKLWLDAGRIFGKCGEGFQRINVATSRKYLEEGLERLCAALGKQGA